MNCLAIGLGLLLCLESVLADIVENAARFDIRSNSGVYPLSERYEVIAVIQMTIAPLGENAKICAADRLLNSRFITKRRGPVKVASNIAWTLVFQNAVASGTVATSDAVDCGGKLFKIFCRCSETTGKIVSRGCIGRRV